MGKKKVVPIKKRRKIAVFKKTKNEAIADRKRAERDSAANLQHKPWESPDVVARKEKISHWVKLAAEKKRAASDNKGQQSSNTSPAQKRKGIPECVPSTSSHHCATKDEMEQVTTTLRPGLRVHIEGLKIALELNGKVATCIRLEINSKRPNRWRVQLEGGAEALCMPRNLRMCCSQESCVSSPSVKQQDARVGPSVRQTVLACLEHEKPDMIRHLIKNVLEEEQAGARPPSLMVIFCNKVSALQGVVSLLNQSHLHCASFNADTKPAKRERALEEFHPDKKKILVTAGDALVGHRIGRCTTCVNYDFPPSLDQYYQRADQVLQDGKGGTYYSFFTPDSAPLAEQIVAMLRSTKAAVDPSFLALLENRGKA